MAVAAPKVKYLRQRQRGGLCSEEGRTPATTAAAGARRGSVRHSPGRLPRLPLPRLPRRRRRLPEEHTPCSGKRAPEPLESKGARPAPLAYTSPRTWLVLPFCQEPSLGTRRPRLYQPAKGQAPEQGHRPLDWRRGWGEVSEWTRHWLQLWVASLAAGVVFRRSSATASGRRGAQGAEILEERRNDEEQLGSPPETSFMGGRERLWDEDIPHKQHSLCGGGPPNSSPKGVCGRPLWRILSRSLRAPFQLYAQHRALYHPLQRREFPSGAP